MKAWCLDNIFNGKRLEYSRKIEQKAKDDEVYSEILKITFFLDKGVPFIQRAHAVVHEIDKHPKCYCGSNLEFRGFKLGYRKFCSVSCSRKNKENCITKIWCR